MLVKLFRKNKDVKPYKLTHNKVKPGQWDDDPVMVRKREEALKILQQVTEWPEELRKRIQK